MKNLLVTLNSKYSHSSLAIRYLSQYVKDESYFPVLKEYTINQHVDDIVRDIFKEDYDVIAFSCYIWNYEMTLKIAQDIKIIDPNITIVLGGPEVSYDPGQILEDYNFIDYIIFGEGERSYQALCEYLFHDVGTVDALDGIAYRGEKVTVNSNRPLIENLDEIPFPYENLNGLTFKKLYYESSRGCPFNCQYCLSSTTGHVRYFSLERVKKDMLFFLNEEVEQVKFVDRTFNASPKRALELMTFIKNHDNGKTNFHFEIVASLLDDETIEFLRTVRVGLFQFEIGVQSTNEDTMIAIKRNVKFSGIQKTVRLLSQDKNIHLHLDLIAGLPYEDFDTFLSSFEDVYALRPEKLQLGFLKLLKGSGLRLNADLHGYKFSQQAPYEIFYNRYISYKELMTLKYVEEIVEMYYNSNRFINCLDMIIKKYYNRAVDFYLEYSNYWVKKGFFDQPHKLMKLYEILFEFCKMKDFDDLPLLKAVMEHDYYLSNIKSPSGFFDTAVDKAFQNKGYDLLKSYATREKSVKKWLKHMKFVSYKYDIIKYLNSDYETINQEALVLMYDYDVPYQVFSKSIFKDVTSQFSKE